MRCTVVPSRTAAPSEPLHRGVKPLLHQVASSLHRACIEPASSLHRACIEPASSLHRACVEPASNLHRACIEPASSLLRACIDGLLRACFEPASSLYDYVASRRRGQGSDEIMMMKIKYLGHLRQNRAPPRAPPSNPPSKRTVKSRRQNGSPARAPTNYYPPLAPCGWRYALQYTIETRYMRVAQLGYDAAYHV